MQKQPNNWNQMNLFWNKYIIVFPKTTHSYDELETFGEEYSRKENPANGLLEFNGNGGGMFSYNQCKMHTKVGDLLIFPYDLRHGVYPFNSTTECRRTLSYNCDLTKMK